MSRTDIGRIPRKLGCRGVSPLLLLLLGQEVEGSRYCVAAELVHRICLHPACTQVDACQAATAGSEHSCRRQVT